MLKPYALRLLTATATVARLRATATTDFNANMLLHPRTVLCGALYTACVDASRTVFWDHLPVRIGQKRFLISYSVFVCCL